MVTAQKDAAQWKLDGNRLMKANMLKAAKLAYENGVEAYICNQSSSDNQNVATFQALHSNLSLVCQKLELWELAIENATKAMDIKIDGKKEVAVAPAKILFRRGVCLESLALSNTSFSMEQKTKLIKDARCDLRECISILNKHILQPDNNTKDNIKQQFKPAKEVYNRICKRLKVIEHEHEQNNGSAIDSFASENAVFVRDSRLSFQRHVVTQLLMQSKQPIEGELYYFLNYSWWKKWCEYIGFKRFDLLSPGGTSISKQLYECLKGDVDNSDESSTSSIDSEQVDDTFPCKINTHGLIENTDGEVRIKAALVRGYHYEIMPREVYYALRAWYGEDEPRIMRRIEVVNDRLCLKLYHSRSVFNGNNHSEKKDLLKRRSCEIP